MNPQKTKIPQEILDGLTQILRPYIPNLKPETLVSALEQKEASSNSYRLPEKRFMLEADVKSMLGCSYWTLRRLRRSGKLIGFKRGKSNVYKISDVNAFLENCRKASLKKTKHP